MHITIGVVPLLYRLKLFICKSRRHGEGGGSQGETGSVFYTELSVCECCVNADM